MIAQEIMYHMHKSKKKKGTLAIKIDLHKAYDSVDWNFLQTTLVDFGFPARIIDLIMFCVSSSSLSLVWNGSRLESFSPNRGLRQGDPISPYLFVLCMEKLSLMISESVDKGDWKPVRVVRGGMGISHLLFADDILVFTEAKVSQLRLVLDILQKFEKASGLKVNVEKSKAMLSKGVPRSMKERLAGESSIVFASHLGRYLGFPLVQGRMKKADFRLLIDKMHSKLSGWKGKLLNKAGRTTLAKAVLTSMPVYHMQSCWVPNSVCDDIDKIVRNFIWKGGCDHGLHLVNWNSVTRSKREGGLGLRQARKTNIAMLGKLIAEIYNNSSKLWVRFLREKYGQNGRIFSTKPPLSSSSTWKAIVQAHSILGDGFKMRLGNGIASFWYVNWLNDRTYLSWSLLCTFRIPCFVCVMFGLETLGI